MLKLGWKAAPEQHPPIALLDYAAVADEAGFDSLNVSDHFHPWSEAGQASYTWTWLGAAAVRTSRMDLGPGLTCPILRYHPAIIAQAAATVSHLARGRTFLCVGTGEALNEYPVTGEWPDYSQRQARLAEAIDLIRRLWSGEEVTHDGQFYHTRRARLYTPPVGPIPLYISTLVPGSASFAGRYGDGLLTTGGKREDTYREIMHNFEVGAREAGKDPAKMARLIEINVEYTDDKEAAIESRRVYWAGSFIPAMFTQRIYSPRMSQENGEAVGADTIEKRSCISADPEEHVRFAGRYVELGFTHLYFHSATPDQRRFLEGYGRDVLPRIRERMVAPQLAVT